MNAWQVVHSPAARQQQQGKIIHSLKRATPLQSDRPPARPSFCPANIILEHGGHKDNELKPKYIL